MSLSADLATFRAFLEDFEQYLKSDAVYWTVRGNLPALTVGGWLLLRRTLAARRGQLAGAEMEAYAALEARAAALATHWPVNIEKKALNEIAARLSQWAGVLEELNEGYPSAITPRVHLALLLALTAHLPEAEAPQRRLAALDLRLKARWQPADFVWAAELAGVFPRDEFWYLYGRPTER